MHVAQACNVEDCFYGTVRVGDRGQIVIPAEARQHLGIQPGDKLMVVRDHKVAGLIVAKIDALQDVVDHLTAIMEHAQRSEVQD